MASSPPRSWPVFYGGLIGAILAILGLVAVLVLWLTNQLDPKLALLFSAAFLSRLV